MSIAAVIKEIISVKAFFSNSKVSCDVVGLQRSFADGVLQKLKQLRVFNVSDGSHVYEALDGEPIKQNASRKQSMLCLRRALRPPQQRLRVLVSMQGVMSSKR